MASLMSISLNFSTKLKFWRFSEKQISRLIDRNLTVGRIEFIETGIEMSTPSLSSEPINKIKIFRKIFIKKRGVPLRNLKKIKNSNINVLKKFGG